VTCLPISCARCRNSFFLSPLLNTPICSLSKKHFYKQAFSSQTPRRPNMEGDKPRQNDLPTVSPNHLPHEHCKRASNSRRRYNNLSSHTKSETVKTIVSKTQYKRHVLQLHLRRISGCQYWSLASHHCTSRKHTELKCTKEVVQYLSISARTLYT
jgi:hypothetical protein